MSEVVRVSSYGLANVETGTPVTADSIFAIASLDKQITATALVKAAELGKLRLDDPVSQWVDIALPGAMLRQLVSHLSGLPDDTVPSFEGRFLTDYSTEQLLQQAQGLVPIAPPGRRFLYSDTGLFLAQLATEKAVDEPWWEFVRRTVFGPAEMKSAVSMAPDLVLPHRVSAYTLDSAGALLRDRRLDTDFGPLYSDLGMNVADFARFLAAQDGGKVLSRSGVGELTTPSRLADGSLAGEIFQWSRYGLGVGLDDLLGEPATLHSGHSGVGFARFPQKRLSVVVFTNLEHPAGSDPVGLAIGVAGLLQRELDLAALAARLRSPDRSGRPALQRSLACARSTSRFSAADPTSNTTRRRSRYRSGRALPDSPDACRDWASSPRSTCSSTARSTANGPCSAGRAMPGEPSTGV
jgi:CubicO group peptidase (beta-lactamase class C family)